MPCTYHSAKKHAAVSPKRFKITYWQEEPVIQPTNEINVSSRKAFGLKDNEYNSMIHSIEGILDIPVEEHRQTGIALPGHSWF